MYYTYTRRVLQNTAFLCMIKKQEKRERTIPMGNTHKNVFFCPTCSGFYRTNQNRVFCPDCNAFCKKLSISDSDFCEFSEEQKERFRQECKQRLKDHKLDMDSQDNQKYTPFKPRASITLVHVMGTLVMMACVVSGISAGPLGLLLGIIGGLASAAGLWLFTGMAEDLQAMRQTVADLSDTLSQMQKKEKIN